MPAIDEEEYRSLVAAREERDRLEAAFVNLSNGLVKVQVILADALDDCFWPLPPAAHAKAKVKQAVELIKELQA